MFAEVQGSMPEENYGLRAQLAQALQQVPRCEGFLVLIKQNAFDEAIASGDEMKRPHELLRSVHDVFKQSLKSWHVALGVSARRVAAIHGQHAEEDPVVCKGF